jgi:hypothetical protein
VPTNDPFSKTTRDAPLVSEVFVRWPNGADFEERESELRSLAIRMELAIREHNAGCRSACGKTSTYQHVRDSRRCDERRDCSDFPMDWVIDLPAID